MKASVQKRQNGVEEYFRYYFTLPKHLMILNKEYLTLANKLISHLKENPQGKVLFKRLMEDGNIQEKTIEGKAIKIKENSFSFISADSLEGNVLYENLHEIHVRTDNVLGWVPFLPGEKLNPFENREDEETKDFFDFLKRAKVLMSEYLNIEHSAILCFRLDDGGKEIIDCEIREVNGSNVKILQKRLVFIKRKRSKPGLSSEEEKVVNLYTGEKNILFLSPEKFLQKVELFPGKNNISPFDDDEIF